MVEMKERKIRRLLLKIKNSAPSIHKTALRQITDKAREFGARPLFNKFLALLMERTPEDQELHLLVKVINHMLYNLDDLVHPYVHKTRLPRASPHRQELSCPCRRSRNYLQSIEGRRSRSHDLHYTTRYRPC